jgi:hypothetical protein
MVKLALGFFNLKKKNHKAPKKTAKKGRLAVSVFFVSQSVVVTQKKWWSKITLTVKNEILRAWNWG